MPPIKNNFVYVSNMNMTQLKKIAEKEKILRAFTENAIQVPAIAQEQETTIEEFEFWEELNISKELFFNVYNSSWMFKDRIDAIYNLCNDKKYLVENYINRVSA